MTSDESRTVISRSSGRCHPPYVGFHRHRLSFPSPSPLSSGPAEGRPLRGGDPRGVEDGEGRVVTRGFTGSNLLSSFTLRIPSPPSSSVPQGPGFARLDGWEGKR